MTHRREFFQRPYGRDGGIEAIAQQGLAAEARNAWIIEPKKNAAKGCSTWKHIFAIAGFEYG